MNNQCICESKPQDLCCPTDRKLRKKWLFTLEKEHEPLRQVSKKVANKLKLLSNPARLEILLMLSLREHCLDEIARKLKVQKSAVSYHLGLLKKHGMICIKKRSRFAFYSLSHEGKKTITFFQNI
ncbi:MAG: metalloregulator ArsR/SmtB family transcription factor [Candidatus Methanoperedens sp.]|nr:metalloregulator ArsR/SmtB family transcription factor [Candidatus Methanoperedens sp.]